MFQYPNLNTFGISTSQSSRMLYHFLRGKMNLKDSTYKGFLNSFPDVDKISNFELCELYELGKAAILFAA